MADLIVRDTDYCSQDVSCIGGKAAGLGYLHSIGISPPASFCITTVGFDQVFRGITREEAKERVAAGKVSDRLQRSIGLNLETLSSDTRKRFIVRSSSACEDQAASMAAGVFRSVRNCNSIGSVIRAVERVWASALGAEALDYYGSVLRSSEVPSMAVIVQVQVEAILSGVTFTEVPGERDPSTMICEFAMADEIPVVDGGTVVSRIAIDKRTLARKWLAGDSAQISQLQLNEVVRNCLAAERAANKPLDIEWLIDKNGAAVIVQCRQLHSRIQRDVVRPVAESASRTSLRSGKLIPFRLQGTKFGPTRQGTVVTPEAFERFRSEGGMSEELRLELTPIIVGAIERGSIAVRPVYWSALNSGDLLPQGGPYRYVSDCLEAIEAIWTYVLKNSLDDYTSEIAVLLSDWIEPIASVVANQEGSLVVISAIPGKSEGLETCRHDSYVADINTREIISRDIQRKPLAVFRARGVPKPLSRKCQDLSTLDDDVLDVVVDRSVRICEKFGASRIEFVLIEAHSPNDSVVVWQVDPATSFNMTRFSVQREQADGQNGIECVFVDLKKIGMTELPDGVRPIVVIDPLNLPAAKRSSLSGLAIELRDRQAIVGLRGSMLSHLASRLREFDLEVISIVGDVCAGHGEHVYLTEDD